MTCTVTAWNDGFASPRHDDLVGVVVPSPMVHSSFRFRAWSSSWRAPCPRLLRTKLRANGACSGGRRSCRDGPAQRLRGGPRVAESGRPDARVVRVATSQRSRCRIQPRLDLSATGSPDRASGRCDRCPSASRTAASKPAYGEGEGAESACMQKPRRMRHQHGVERAACATSRARRPRAPSPSKTTRLPLRRNGPLPSPSPMDEC